MCGLTGYYNFNGKREHSSETVDRMLSLQQHRGPDDSGIVAIDTESGVLERTSSGTPAPFAKQPDLIFGFNRLSILDLSSNGHQPMVSKDGDVVLMMNGEVYNAFDYKDDLKREGYPFKSTTDTEVVLNLYLKYGMERMIGMLNGMFAIVIWDKRTRKLYLARDRFGIKPLYVLRESERFAFSSEMKSFKALPDFYFDLEKDRLDEFLLFRNTVNETLFKNIRNCTPGTYLTVNTEGEIEEHVFYDINREGGTPVAGKNALGMLEQSLNESVRRQMVSDVKLGCQLSGGVDSSLVSWYAKQSLNDGALETISIKFSNSLFSEEKFIDEVVQNLKLIAHKYIMTPEYYFQELDNAAWHFEQPLNHPNTIGIYLLSQEAKKHVTVLLSGEGADEALAGYDRFVDITGSAFFSRSFISKIKQHSTGLVPFLRYYMDDDSRRIMASSFGGIGTASGLYPDFNFMAGLEKRKKILEGLAGECVLRQRKYELLTYLPDLLMRQDKMSMAHSIENRVPFLDNEMVAISLNLPAGELVNYKDGRKEGKLLLKKLCAEKFGDAFSFRKKKGFGIPLRDFMSTSYFRDKWFSVIEPGIKARDIFCAKPLSCWVSNIESANSVQLDAIWLMTGFEIWAKKYLDL